MYGHRYSPEERAFMACFVPKHSYKEIAAAFTDKFGWEISISQVKSYIGNHRLNTGRTGRFKKGQEPPNKGVKGVCAAGCERTWFKKGHIPKNHRSVGSERINVDGYIEVKVAEPNKWRLKHNVIWEECYGKIPENHVVLFLDGNKLNLDISNLKLIKRSELLIMNRYNLCNENAKVTEVATNLSRLIDTTNKAKRR